MPHKRSLRAQVIRYIYRTSFQDHTLCETVCTTTRRDLIDWVTSNEVVDTYLDIHTIPDVDHGLILVDSRGRGAFQPHPSDLEEVTPA